MTCSVYILHSSTDPTPRYVGVTTDTTQRLSEHVSVAWTGNSYNNDLLSWLRELLPDEPRMRVLCVVASIEEAKRIEERYTTVLAARGVPLCNKMIGGCHSASSIAKMRANWTFQRHKVQRNRLFDFWTPERRAEHGQKMRARPAEQSGGGLPDWSAKAHVRRLLKQRVP